MGEEYRPFKRRRVDLDANNRPTYEEDVYERDDDGRPIGFKRGSGSVVRRRSPAEGPPIKPYLVLSGVFAGVLLLSGQPLYAGVVAAVTFAVYLVSRWRR